MHLLVTGKNELNQTKFRPIKNDRFYINKPSGGLWASTYTPNEKYSSDWIKWAAENYFMLDRLKQGMLIKIKRNIKVAVINTYQDLQRYLTKYEFHPPKDFPIVFNRYLDFEKMAQYYQAIHLTKKGVGETLGFYTPFGQGDLYGWDCESWLIMDYNIIEAWMPVTLKKYKGLWDETN